MRLKRRDLLLGRYQVIAFLGSGGMSTVYLAEDSEGGCYAVKESRMEPRWAHQLMVEAKMLQDLDHPQLPGMKELFMSGDREYFYIIQEYIEGFTLSKLFRLKRGNIPYRDLLGYFIQICDVLQYLHDQNIVYKDLKPANIMITKDHVVKVIDFGIARKYGEGTSKDHVQMGTIGFAAPEQFNEGETDHRTDLFSLGTLMFHLFSGGDYWEGDSRHIKKFKAEFPGKLAKCIERLTRLDPDERLQSASEVRVILQRLRNKKRFFGREVWGNMKKEKPRS